MTEITGKHPFPLSYLSAQSGKWVQFSKVCRWIIVIDLNHRKSTRLPYKIPLCLHLHLEMSAYCKYFLWVPNQGTIFAQLLNWSSCLNQACGYVLFSTKKIEGWEGHRIIWVGADLQVHWVQPLTTALSNRPWHWVPHPVGVFLNSPRDSNSSTSLGSPFQGLTTLSVKTFLLLSNLNLPWCSLVLFPLVLLLFVWEKRREGRKDPSHPKYREGIGCNF